VVKEVVEVGEKALTLAVLTWKRNKCLSLAWISDLSRRGKMATDPICCTREGSPRARLWLWGHSREKVDERDKDKRMHHTLWTGNITAVKGHQ